MSPPLPIDALLPQIVDALTSNGSVVVQAAPGAGKTTRVPAALLDARLSAERQVVVLEPRRIAARAAAEFVARERGGEVGGEIGYRVRFEQRGSSSTRLWFVTEGMFTRQLGRNPFLDDIGVVVLDEFHERHLQTDLALAIVLELQRSLRPDLKLVVMSATLAAERVAAHLGGCPLVRSAGRQHPVAIEFLTTEDRQPIAERVTAALRRLPPVSTDDGDILVFLPGAKEIRRTASAAAAWAETNSVDVVPLYGDLPLPEQYRAIRKGARRKLILSTNVAETALTVEAVTTVIDSGLARRARFDPQHGINSLALARISRASADQRAGRAGRVSPGRCLRLWTAADHRGRIEHEIPEILRLDLAELLLELRAWGLADPEGLAWLDVPRADAWRRAKRLLYLVGALDPDTERLTDVGGRMLRLSLPPRLARILIEAGERGCREPAALVAALAAERDIGVESHALAPTAVSFRSHDSDLLLRLERFEQAARGGFGNDLCRALGLDPGAVRNVERVRRQLLLASRSAPAEAHASREDDLLRCVLAGFPDRVVRRRAPHSPRGVMVGGTGVILLPSSAVREAELFVAIEIEAARGADLAEARVRVASAIDREWLDQMFPAAMKSTSAIEFDEQREAVIERRRICYYDLVLEESLRPCADGAAASALLAEAARRDPRRACEVQVGEQGFLDRIEAARRWIPEVEWPSAEELLARTVAELCVGRRSFADLRRVELLPWLRAQLGGELNRVLDRELPLEYPLPSGRNAKLRYERDRPPSVAARIQEVFGLTSTPRVARGRVPLVVELLAPNGRPVQITDDLASFWRATYAEVRKQLRGRYPKHAWPEDPSTATPTRRK